jgi:glycosyltransferase involved in cell wall biosynthesis
MQKRALSPKVSVIMTSFNAGATLEWAVRSVLDQTVSNLELFIVDDRSEDNSREIIQALADTDPRIKPIFNDHNMGTYASKNQAIRQCSGEFITFHDSDDWMHSQRIEIHLNAMKHGIMCSTSNWIRMDGRGRIIVRRDGPYTHLNPASTFFRRSVFDRVGSFDCVRTGADSEILTRIRHRLGQSAVTHLPDVLAIGLHHEASLTQSGATAFDEHRYSPVRLEYTEAWVKWHLEVLTRDREALSLNIGPEGRPFDIPPQIAP